MGTSRRLAGSDDGMGMTDRTGWSCGGENQRNRAIGEEGWGPPTERRGVAHPRNGEEEESDEFSMIILLYHVAF